MTEPPETDHDHVKHRILVEIEPDKLMHFRDIVEDAILISCIADYRDCEKIAHPSHEVCMGAHAMLCFQDPSFPGSQRHAYRRGLLKWVVNEYGWDRL